MNKNVLVFIVTLIFVAGLTTLLYHKTQQADINYYKGHRFFKKGQYENAMKYCEKTLTVKPSHVRALKIAAYSCQWMSDYQRAIELFNQILSITPQDYQVMDSLAETLAWNKEYGKSIALYKKIVKFSGKVKAQKQLAQVYIWNNQPDEAKKILEEVLRENSDDLEAKLLIAKAMHYSREAEEAVQVYKEVIAKKKVEKAAEKGIKEKEEIEELLGEAYMISKDYESAVKRYREILKKYPKNTKVRLGLADILSWQKKYNEAIDEYRKALNIEPENIDIKKKLAMVCLWKKDYIEAEKLLKDVIGNNPRDIDALASMGEVLSRQKRYKEAIYYFEIALSENKEDKNLIFSYVQILFFSGGYEQAEKILKDIISGEPQNLEAKIYLADICAYTKRFDEAISLYTDVLQEKDTLEVKKKLADIMSWDKRYDEALKLYDKILNEEEDKKTRLQKARVLGWTRKYSKSLSEYQKILDIENDPLIELEMKAKKAYWNNRVKHAITYYKKLIEKDSQNAEAMFDLSQIYSYQSMWEDAVTEYERILDITSTHFRAREGLEKINLISKHPYLKGGYEFFRAESLGRDTDIKRHTFVNLMEIPFTFELAISINSKLTNRSFSDSGDLMENETKIGIDYKNTPDWWIGGFYDLITYDKDINAIHTFGGNANCRIFDTGAAHFSFDRERLENTSKVIEERYYSDNYKIGFDLDITKRVKLNADYLYSHYSDGNYKNEPGFGALYCLLLDPTRLALRYDCFYREFDRKVNEYFSPTAFWTNKFAINWRHFLNKEEIFFGADDIYYDIDYAISIDSKDIAGHTLGVEFNWDINKQLNLNLKGTVVNSSANVYKDRYLAISVKYYF